MQIDWKALRRAGYAKTRAMARKYYYSIGPIVCPALGYETVLLNAKGFNHLIRKKDLRPKTEQKRRFLLLRYMKDIIEDRDVVVTRRYVHGSIGRSLYDETCYWGLEKEYGSFSIRVVIRQIGNGHKHFYSIMRV